MAIKYKWLADLLRNEITQNLANGIEKLPTEQELCKNYAVSRQTVREALSLLEKDGLIEKRQGSGTFVTGLMPGMERNEIALLISSEHEYLYPDTISRIRNTLLKSGFLLNVYETNNSITKERELLNILLRSSIRGIIVEGCKSTLPNPNISYYRQLEAMGIPTIFLYNRYPNYEESISVMDENEEGSATLVHHLMEQGHVNIGGLFKVDDIQGLGRYKGFMDTLYKENIPVNEEQICFYDSEDLDKLRKNQNTLFLRTMITEHFKDCTSLVCYNDEIAYWMIHELNHLGYHLPQDMAITAFDNTYLSNHEIISITTLSHRSGEMADTATELLLRKLKGLPVFSGKVPWFLITKDSSQ